MKTGRSNLLAPALLIAVHLAGCASSQSAGPAAGGAKAAHGVRAGIVTSGSPLIAVPGSSGRNDYLLGSSTPWYGHSVAWSEIRHRDHLWTSNGRARDSSHTWVKSVQRSWRP